MDEVLALWEPAYNSSDPYDHAEYEPFPDTAPQTALNDAAGQSQSPSDPFRRVTLSWSDPIRPVLIGGQQSFQLDHFSGLSLESSTSGDMAAAGAVQAGPPQDADDQAQQDVQEEARDRKVHNDREVKEAMQGIEDAKEEKDAAEDQLMAAEQKVDQAEQQVQELQEKKQGIQVAGIGLTVLSIFAGLIPGVGPMLATAMLGAAAVGAEMAGMGIDQQIEAAQNELGVAQQELEEAKDDVREADQQFHHAVSEAYDEIDEAVDERRMLVAVGVVAAVVLLIGGAGGAACFVLASQVRQLQRGAAAAPAGLGAAKPLLQGSHSSSH